MNAYLVDQTQQMERAKTFAPRPGLRYGAGLSGRSAPWPPAAAALSCRVTPLSRREARSRLAGIPSRPGKGCASVEQA